jgi:Sulfotransferase family
MKNSKYLIIGGTTKAATTSLYYYLSEHPDVCGSTLKETRFFIDSDYPVAPLASHWSQGLDKYEEFFKHDSNLSSPRLEATPDYLYSSGTARRIKEALPNAKIVFILREPISRLMSWYKYAKQRAFISESMSLEEYIECQLEDKLPSAPEQKDDAIAQAYFFSALEHGRYSAYLQKYFDEFGRDRVYVAFFDDLTQRPQAVLESLCGFAGLDPSFYADYNFKVFNRSETMKNAGLHRAYGRFRSGIRKWTHNLPIHMLLRRLRRWFDSIYYPLNTQNSEKMVLSPDIQSKLEDYYQADSQALEKLLGYSVPWNRSAPTSSVQEIVH